MDGPPELSVRIPNSRDLPKHAYLLTELSKNLVIDFLLVTAVDCELLSCFYYLQEPLKYYDTNTDIVYVGKMGDEGEQEKLTIGLVKCSMGSGVGGSASTVQNVVTTLRPKGVFCVGFCGGMNARKAKLGDVVVSKELISYALHKATDAGIEPRGTKVPLNKMVNGIMKHAGDGWDPPLKDKEKAGKVVNGTMLSGPTLVNSKQEQNRLLECYPTATAIEMEGEGVYAAAHNLQIEWVVVKGVSDYADGTKDATKDWKPYASMMAASLVANVLSKPSVFKDWPRYDGGDSSTRRSSASPTERRHDFEDSSTRRSSASPTERRHDFEGSPSQSPAGPSGKRPKDSSPCHAANRDNQVSEDVPDKLVADLSQRMARQWKLVATYLGFTYDRVTIFDADNHSVSEKIIAMLGEWKQRQTKDATRSNLMTALKKAGREDLAEEVWSYKE